MFWQRVPHILTVLKSDKQCFIGISKNCKTIVKVDNIKEGYKKTGTKFCTGLRILNYQFGHEFLCRDFLTTKD